ncbi:MAG: PHP domain-containing protein [Desulfomonilia bacterium]|nr:PHP domain-containing protein [Desulfomonilia bacterium]
MIDLHIHTTGSSDGQHRPREIMEMSRDLGLESVAFADHMDVSSIEEGFARATELGIEFFPGVELSTWYEGTEHHLLMYSFVPGLRELDEFLGRACSGIWDSASILIDRFRGLGYDITPDDVSRWGKSVPTGVTLLDALKKRNSHDGRLAEYLSGPKASSPYLNFYRDISRMGLLDGLEMILPGLGETLELFREKGVLVLAHPGKINEEILVKLKGYGLAGIEAYSSHHDAGTTNHLVALARRTGLHVSAGSDFHGHAIKPGIQLGAVTGVPDERLMALLREALRSRI